MFESLQERPNLAVKSSKQTPSTHLGSWQKVAFNSNEQFLSPRLTQTPLALHCAIWQLFSSPQGLPASLVFTPQRALPLEKDSIGPVSLLHVADWHKEVTESMQTKGSPTQKPASQTSECVHEFWSLQVVLSGKLTLKHWPLSELQTHRWQGFCEVGQMTGCDTH